MRANRRCMNGKRIRKSSKAAFKSVSESPLNSATASAFKHASDDPLAHPHAKGSYDGHESRFEAIKANKENPEASKEHNTKNATPKAKPLFSNLQEVQTALTAAEYVPGAIGTVSGGANAALSTGLAVKNLLTGDFEGAKTAGIDAGLSIAGVIPGPTGWAATTSKVAGHAGAARHLQFIGDSKGEGDLAGALNIENPEGRDKMKNLLGFGSGQSTETLAENK